MALKVARLTTFDSRRHELAGHAYVEPKLDGMRCLIASNPLGTGAWSRNGAGLTGARRIVHELGQALDLDRWVVDGELLDGACEQSAAAAHSRDSDAILHVFDLIRADEWRAGYTRPLTARHQDMADHLPLSPHVRLVPSLPVCEPSAHDLLSYRDRFVAEGYEGVVWKLDVGYPFGRSRDWIRSKPHFTADGIIDSVIEGEGRHEGQLKALVVWIPETGQLARVGSGFDQKRRQDLETWRSRVGLHVEVRYQELRPSGTLRFPVFSRMRPDLDPVATVLRPAPCLSIVG